MALPICLSMNKAVLLLLFLTSAALGQDPVRYQLEYFSGNDFLSVTMHIPDDAREQTNTLIIPRSAPGTYAFTDYAEFVEQVHATSVDGDVLHGERGQGSYFSFASGLTTLLAPETANVTDRRERWRARSESSP